MLYTRTGGVGAEPCLRCCGTGVYHPDEHGRPAEEECFDCDGTGYSALWPCWLCGHMIPESLEPTLGRVTPDCCEHDRCARCRQDRHYTVMVDGVCASCRGDGDLLAVQNAAAAMGRATAALDRQNAKAEEVLRELRAEGGAA